VVVTLGTKKPLVVLLNSRIDDGSGVMAVLLIHIDCAFNLLLFAKTRSKHRKTIAFKELEIVHPVRKIFFILRLDLDRSETGLKIK